MSLCEIKILDFFRELGVQYQDRVSSVSGVTTRVRFGNGFHVWNRASFASDVTNPVSGIKIQVRREEAHCSLNIMSTHTCDWIVASNVVETTLRHKQCALH